MNPEQVINVEGNATIAGLRTTYGLRKTFANQLQDLFARIEELNRPTPMTEGEYLEFANIVKELNKFATDFQQQNPVYVALRASVARPERAQPTATLAKAEDPKRFKFCSKCDTYIAKKGWSKHKQTSKCLTIQNSKRIACGLTLTDRPEHFNKTTNHKFYQVGQILIADFARRKAKSEDWITNHIAEMDAVRLQSRTDEPPPPARKTRGRPKKQTPPPVLVLSVEFSDDEDEPVAQLLAKRIASTK